MVDCWNRHKLQWEVSSHLSLGQLSKSSNFLLLFHLGCWNRIPQTRRPRKEPPGSLEVQNQGISTSILSTKGALLDSETASYPKFSEGIGLASSLLFSLHTQLSCCPPLWPNYLPPTLFLLAPTGNWCVKTWESPNVQGVTILSLKSAKPCPHPCWCSLLPVLMHFYNAMAKLNSGKSQWHSLVFKG